MRKYVPSLLSLLLLLGLALPLSAQRVVDIAASTDPANPTDIFPLIMGDTTSTGAREDSNTIYTLENGQVYITTGRIVNSKGWKLHIEAKDLDNTDLKPVLSRIPNASGSYPDIMRPEGDVVLKNIWIIAGEKGPLEQHDWGKIRLSGANTRVIVSDCIIEKDRGGFLQFRADGIKCYVTNCILRNGGNRMLIQGNGRGIDAREFSLDTLIMKNTVVHNLIDRFFRSQAGKTPHNYIEIDHCTGFNIAGRHGFIQLGRVNTAKITNNLFVNPIMLGTSPVYTDEQTQPDGDQHKVITLDTLYTATQLTISNNNIHWTQDVLNYFASNDSVSKPPVLSQLVKDVLGADTTNAFFEEVVSLDSVPMTIFQYVQDLYADPTATDMFDFVVEDISRANTSFDNGNLFDFNEFSPCYPSGTTSATGDTEGRPVGAVASCDNLFVGLEEEFNTALNLKLAPNPIYGGDASFHFEQEEMGRVSLSIFNLHGQRITTLVDQLMGPGAHQVDWQVAPGLPAGVYIARLQTTQGFQSLKFSLR